MSFLDDDLSTGLSKIGGPLALFILDPLHIWFFWKLRFYEVWNLNWVETLNVFGFIAIFAAQTIFGVWMCRKGYGWFGGRRPPKPEL